MRWRIGIKTCCTLAFALMLSAAYGADKQKKAEPPPKPPLPAAAALSAKSAILIDEVSGRVLWEKGANDPRYPASTTKILTALLLIERCRPDDIVIAPADIEKTGEASLHLKPGERLTVKDLLWGILLRSANDGCVAAAIHCSGSVEAFCKLMNERAAQIGCANTHFTNPNGLKDPLHTTTARDLALIAREAMKYPEFREIVRNRRHTIGRSINGADTLLVSKNKFLHLDPTADGIKTGFTRPAGQCFVGSASRGGNRLISVVLLSESWLPDTMKLMNWGFANHEVQRPRKAGEALEERAPLAGGGSILVGPVRAVRYFARKGESGGLTQTAAYAPNLGPPIARGQQVGVLNVDDGKGWSDQIPLVALETLPGSRVQGSTSKLPFIVMGLGFFGLWAFTRRKRKRLYARYTPS